MLHHLPQRTEKLPTTGGHVEPTLRHLKRVELMAVLGAVREDFVRRWLGRQDTPEVRVALDELQAIRAALLGILDRVPDPYFAKVPAGESWSCHDLVNHLSVDEYNEFHPEPPAALSHVIGQDTIHLAQARRLVARLGIEGRAQPSDPHA